MYLKTAFVALFILAPLANVNTARAAEYLIISNLPDNQSTEDVRKLVEALGEVKSIKCYNVQFTGRNKRSCNILMGSTEDARKVVEKFSGAQLSGKELYAKEVYPVPCPLPKLVS